jgi:Flp pilus assembly protein TadD
MILRQKQFARPVLMAALAIMLYGCGATTPVQPGANTSQEQTKTGESAETGGGIDAKAEGSFELAKKLIKRGDFADAEEVLFNTTRDFPDLPGPYANLGMVLEKKKDYQNAEIALKRAIELAPQKPEPYNHLGIVYRREGKFRKALETYKKGLQVSPDYRNLLLNTGILLELYLNAPQQALEYYQRYLEQVPDDKQVQIWIADIKQRSGS